MATHTPMPTPTLTHMHAHTSPHPYAHAPTRKHPPAPARTGSSRSMRRRVWPTTTAAPSSATSRTLRRSGAGRCRWACVCVWGCVRGVPRQTGREAARLCCTAVGPWCNHAGGRAPLPSPAPHPAFYDRYYGPANLTICIVGDVEPEAVQRLAEQYWGLWQPEGYVTLPRGDGGQASALAAGPDPRPQVCLRHAPAAPPTRRGWGWRPGGRSSWQQLRGPCLGP